MSKYHNYKDYVCNNCFYQLDKCNCAFDPLVLIQIDENIQYAVRLLNEKGYATECCCEGHYDDKIKGGYIYISFAQRYAPHVFPDGWKISRDNNKYHPTISVGMRIKSNSKIESRRKKQFEAKKKEAINNLNKWADSLGTNENY